MGMVLETVTGKLVDIENPTIEHIDIEDIAWGLSRIARFCGATITPIPYNVAQHSLLVAKKVEEDLDAFGWDSETLKANGLGFSTIMKALLHDASEVYTGDVPSPVKKLDSIRPVFKELEHKLMAVIYQKFGLKESSYFEEMVINNADKWAQKIEAHAFMPSRGAHWEGLPNVTLEELQSFSDPLPALQSYKLFKARFEELLNYVGSDGTTERE